jgi:hypothetical protein
MRLPRFPVRVLTSLLSLGCLSTTARAQETWKLTETLRIGGAETGPEAFLYPKALEADAKGRIFVYDRKTQDIRLFAADGKFMRVISRVGSGPGEMRDAEGIAFAPDGRLWIRDAANARFTILPAEGVYENSWTMRFCWSQGAWDPVFDDRGRLLNFDCIGSGGRAGADALLAYHTDRSRVDTLGMLPECGTRALAESGTWITRTERGTRYRQIPHAPSAFLVTGRSGESWCVPNSSRYEIVRYGPGSRDTMRITRSVRPVPVTAKARDSIVQAIQSERPAAEGLDFGRIPRTKPAVDKLTIDDRGRLWVRRIDERGALLFDIYRPNGQHLASAELGVYTIPAIQPFIVRGDNLYAVIVDEDDVPQVARFRISRQQ